MSKVLGLFARVNHWEVKSWPKWSDSYISYLTSIELNQVKMNMFNTEIVSNCGHCHVSRWSGSFLFWCSPHWFVRPILFVLLLDIWWPSSLVPWLAGFLQLVINLVFYDPPLGIPCGPIISSRLSFVFLSFFLLISSHPHSMRPPPPNPVDMVWNCLQLPVANSYVILLLCLFLVSSPLPLLSLIRLSL